MHTFFIISIEFYRNELLDIMPGVWFLMPLHPAGAQNNSLISNTALKFRYVNFFLRAQDYGHLVTFSVQAGPKRRITKTKW